MFKIGDVVVATRSVGAYIQKGDDFDVLLVSPEVPGMEQEHIGISVCGKRISLPSSVFVLADEWKKDGNVVNVL